MIRKSYVLLLLLGVGLLLSCDALPGGCTARQPVISAYRSFNDLHARAAATSRIALSPVVGEMQAARRALDNIPVTNCGQDIIEAHTRMREWMDADIQAFLAFMSTNINDDPLVQIYVQRAVETAALAQQQIERIWK